MTRWDRVIGGEGKFIAVSDRPLDFDPADWVRTIQYEHRQFQLCSFFEDVAERGDVSVEAGANVLNVVDQRVKIFKLLRFWSPCFAVERIDRETRRFVFGIGNFFVR